MLQVCGGQGSEQRRQRAPHLAEVLQKLSNRRDVRETRDSPLRLDVQLVAVEQEAITSVFGWFEST